jgi:hypothetical protein
MRYRAYFRSKTCSSYWMVCDLIDGKYFPVGTSEPWTPTKDYTLMHWMVYKEAA